MTPEVRCADRSGEQRGQNRLQETDQQSTDRQNLVLDEAGIEDPVPAPPLTTRDTVARETPASAATASSVAAAVRLRHHSAPSTPLPPFNSFLSAMT